jgi:hypothetical protein
LTSIETVQNALLADLALKGYLNDAERLWKPCGVFLNRRYQHVELMRRSVTHELKVVRGVFIMASDV